MNQSFTRNGQASIINLFEKMDSNITKFRASLTSTPRKHADEDCSCICIKNSKERLVERDFYLRQEELVRSASTILKAEGNQTFARLLNFMSDYLARIGEELKYQLLCECKIQKIEDYHNLTHKISFLREENHKFFRMIEEKTEECEELRLRIDHLEASNSEKHHEETPLTDHHKSRLPFASMLSEEITSRIISSNSSRVSQFRHAWPELTLPLGEVGHRRYFQPSPGDRCAIFDSREVLQQKSLNHPFESTFRKTKIFDHH